MWDGISDMFADLASAGGKIFVDAWTSICLAVWNAGLWLMRVILSLGDWFLTPNLSPESGSSLLSVYGITLWLALGLALVLLIVQLISTVVRRDAASLGATLTGSVKFLLVCSLWYVYGAALVTAVAGLNTALRRTLLGTEDISQWQPDTLSLSESVVSGSTATVLLLMGLLLWLGALAHLVVMLGRAVSLIVISATAPLAAAGLMYKPFEAWFWKAFRWFHAAAFAPLLMTLMLGTGVQLASGVALGLEDSGQEAIALALPSVVMIVVAALSPVGLFRMLAFVDPGTSSGASFRAGLAAPRRVSDGANNVAGNLSNPASLGSETASQSRSVGVAPSSLATATGSVAVGGTTTAAGAGGGGTAAGVAGGAGAAGPVGLVAAGVVLGAKKLVDGFQRTGAMAAGVVADSNSTMGVGDQSYPYDPSHDVRVTPSRRPDRTTREQGRRGVPVPVKEAEDRNGGESL
ncbi:hypothetical protein [Tessaracoccus sp. MC1756]|uniref:hypothetical protein n=1 Tax=Tessaracoccus sp. MC1756 TaxID=2760311 RepID=UPI0016026192|nr:hypothetical protein [Tessaracoccus sp. MC1756]MBB1510645.1 hypothetical protein [Tessaracoccus sp. MC1756]